MVRSAGQSADAARARGRGVSADRSSWHELSSHRFFTPALALRATGFLVFAVVIQLVVQVAIDAGSAFAPRTSTAVAVGLDVLIGVALTVIALLAVAAVQRMRFPRPLTRASPRR